MKFVSYNDISRLKKKGYKACDMHVHTCYSSDVLPINEHSAESVYKTAKGRGMDFVTFTDHENIDASQKFKENEDFVRGVEFGIKTNSGHTIHFNAYCLSGLQFTELQKLCLECNLFGCVEYMNSQGILFTYNHPFWCKRGESFNIRYAIDIARLFPVIEYSSFGVAEFNRHMRMITRGKKAISTGTDTHTGNPGNSFVLARGADFYEFFDNIKRGRHYIYAENLTRSRFIHEMNDWINKLFIGEFTMHDKKIENIGGGKAIDNFVRFLSRTGVRRNKFIAYPIREALLGISNSGIAAEFYIKGQMNLLKKFDRYSIAKKNSDL